MLATITVDYKKCTAPFSCRKCLLICPNHVLGLGTDVGPQKFREIDASHFKVEGVRFDKCTVCLKCVDVCPENAIEVCL